MSLIDILEGRTVVDSSDAFETYRNECIAMLVLTCTSPDSEARAAVNQLVYALSTRLHKMDPLYEIYFSIDSEGEPSLTIYAPDGDKISLSNVLLYVHRYNRERQRRLALAMGLHDRVGHGSAMNKQFNGPLGERRVLGKIAEFADYHQPTQIDVKQSAAELQAAETKLDQSDVGSVVWHWNNFVKKAAERRHALMTKLATDEQVRRGRHPARPGSHRAHASESTSDHESLPSPHKRYRQE